MVELLSAPRSLEIFNENQATFVEQFENALRAIDEIKAIDSDRIQITTRHEGTIHSFLYDKWIILTMANQIAFRRWLDLKEMSLEDVANDVLYQREVKKYL